MSFGAYVLGVGTLALAIVPLWFASVALQRRFWPAEDISSVVLIRAVVLIALVVGISEALGTVGAFRRGPITVACAVIGVALTTWARRRRTTEGCATEDRATEVRVRGGRHVHVQRSDAVALAIVGIATALWLARTVTVVRHGGTLGTDSLDYHLPFAARFAQQGRTWPLHYTTPGNETPFDPANAELLLGFFILPFHRDVLVPFANLGWLLLAIVAAWNIGRVRNVPALSAACVAVLAGSHIAVQSQAGTADNDVVSLALLLACAALLLGRPWTTRNIVIAGIAAGLGLGTKLSLAVPVAALTVGVILLAGRTRRARLTAAWAAALLATGGYWYARNLIAVGNPLPSLHVGIGSLKLPAPHLSQVDHFDYTVGYYLRDANIWHRYFLPGLRTTFGPMWPLLMVMAVGGLVLTLVKATRVEQMLALVGIASLLAYLVTPTSAAGPRGVPWLFVSNLRYILPALGLALALLAPALTRLFGHRARWLIIGLAVVALASQRSFRLVIAVAAVVLLAVAVSSFVRAVRPTTRALASAFIAVVVVAVIIGFPIQRQFLHRRYRSVGTALGPTVDAKAINALYIWARTVSHSRIGIVELQEQYPLDGVDLSNYVQYVGVHEPAGGYERATRCNAWRQAVNAGHYDYLAIAPVDVSHTVPIETVWMRGQTSAVAVLHVDRIIIFRLHGALDTTTCNTTAPRPAAVTAAR